MKLPICELCASTNVLCSGCSERLATGRLTQLDVDASRLLHRLAADHPLDNIELKRALDLGKVVLLLVRGDIGALIGREGRVVNEISKGLGRKVRIAEDAGDLKKTLADIIAPARLLGINQVFRKEGNLFRVRIPKTDLPALPVPLSVLEKALVSLFSAPAEIAFE
ncbi:MAG: hypothetical protein QXG98_00970 [Candidatus Micrarchaeia archaeon]